MSAVPADPERVRSGLERLRTLLPLAARQAALPAPWRALHRRILREFAARGRAPVPVQHGEFSAAELEQALAALADADLVLRGPDGGVLGTYPFTTEPTPHRLELAAGSVYAMCAVDALAVAPVFVIETRIRSCCALSGAEISVHQKGGRLQSSTPEAPWVGIHWREPDRCAAHSLCREMLFLRDARIAGAWRDRAPERRSVYPLPEAVLLGAGFFAPLVGRVVDPAGERA